METVNAEINASVLYTTYDGEEYDPDKPNSIDLDQWMNSTSHSNGA